MRTRLHLTALMLLALLAAFGPAAASGPAASSVAGSAFTRRDRLGVAFARSVVQGSQTIPQSLDTYDLAALQLGWYSDWSYNATPLQPRDVTPETTLEYVQLITVRDGQWPPNWAAVRAAASANPGALWIIGNEPECPNQGNLTPAQYATRYHDALLQLQTADPSVRLAIGGVVEPTPLRLHWLDATLVSYQAQFGHPMTADIDVWNIHVQILPEGPGAGAGNPTGIVVAPGEPREYALADSANVAIFQTLVREMRAWLAAKGERAKPLIISEMGVLMPSYYLVEDPTLSDAAKAELGDRLIEQYMTHTFDWLFSARDAAAGCSIDANLLVQRWLWFSLNDSFYDEATNPTGFNGALFDYGTQTPTRFGRRLIDYQAQTERLFLTLTER